MLVSVALGLVSTVLAWGSEGHSLVGGIAQEFLTPQAKEGLLELFPEVNGQLKQLTNWADKIKSNRVAYGWSNGLHYVNPQDNPTTLCEYVDTRDCRDGNCIVGAIANFTEQSRCNRPTPMRIVAIKFLSHFIGDLAQPLHACGRARGGNDVSVTFDGRLRKLHVIWDTDILLKRIRNDFKDSVDQYQSFLIQTIRTGAFTSVASSWLSKSDVFARTANGNSKAAIEWTNDSNGLNCKTIWNAYDADPDHDFFIVFLVNLHIHVHHIDMIQSASHSTSTSTSSCQEFPGIVFIIISVIDIKIELFSGLFGHVAVKQKRKKSHLEGNNGASSSTARESFLEANHRLCAAMSIRVVCDFLFALV
jgi:hypothetical protein